MSKVIVDDVEVDNFARQLNTFSRDLGSQRSKLRALFRRLGETWRDPQYKKFAKEFEQTMKNLDRFVRAADEVVPKLRGTAQRIRDVHR